MKNRRNVVVAFLLVAAMLLGIGYAELTDVLTINGNVSVSQSTAEEAFNEDIKFTNVTKSADTFEAIIDTTTDATSDTGKITIPAGVLKGAGDFVTATYTITNSGDLDATVAIPDITVGDEDYFEVTTDWDAAKTVTANNGTVTVTVTITLTNTPVEDLENVSFTLTFDVETVQQENT